MKTYVVCAQFTVPHYVHLKVKARSEEEALKKVEQYEEVSATFWDGQHEDYDSSGATEYYVAEYDTYVDHDLT